MGGRWTRAVVAMVAVVGVVAGCTASGGDDDAAPVPTEATSTTEATTTTTETTTTTTTPPFPPDLELGFEVLVSDEARPTEFTLDTFVATDQAELDHLWDDFGFGGAWQLLGPAPTVDFDQQVALALVSLGLGCPPRVELRAAGDRLTVIEDADNMACHPVNTRWSHLIVVDRAHLPERFVLERRSSHDLDHLGHEQEIELLTG